MKQKSKTEIHKNTGSIFNNKIKTEMPSQYSMYRELVREIGITSPFQKNLLRFNFKEKYQRHMKIVEDHRSQKQSFEKMRAEELLKREIQLKNIRETILSKQRKAKEKKIEYDEIKKQKTKFLMNKWEKVVSGKKKQTDSFKNSLKLLKSWNEKCSQAKKKKNEELQKITNKSHDHNEKVTNRYLSVFSSASFQNPERSVPLTNSQKSIEHGNKKKNPISEIKYKNTLNQKKQLDEIQLQKSLQLNVSKEKRIAEARDLKKYLYSKRTKQIKNKEITYKAKCKQNTKRLEEIDQIKKKQLEKKLREDRTKGREISLPIMNRKALKSQLQDPDDEDAYLTMLPEDNSHKYNKLILDKLRSVSIRMNKNNRQTTMFS